jgi:hypothetical protein
MRAWAVLAAAALLAPAAAANDTIAETAAGGLVFKRSEAIDMVSEDLFVSADRVEVRYVFRNRSGRDIRATVAFPVPDVDLAQEWDQAVPLDFRTLVDGAPAPVSAERKALLGDRDHSAVLAGLGVPLSDNADRPGGAVIPEALAALSPPDQERLVQLGLAGWEEYDAGAGMRRHLVPLWTVKETFFWEQVFPAGRDLVVEHSYVPGAGVSVGTPLVDKEFRRSPEGREAIARHCADGAFLRGVDRLASVAGNDYPALPEIRIAYILTTGANWRTPIGRFRLVVDKGAPENLVSFCGDGVRKISPTRFELVRTNWRPDRELHVLIVQPMPAPGS